MAHRRSAMGPSPPPPPRAPRATPPPATATIATFANSTPRRGAPPARNSTTTATTRPRPAWNAYLTDDRQYKLTQEKQLLRHLQHATTAHYQTATRSPMAGAARRARPTTTSTAVETEPTAEDVTTGDWRQRVRGTDDRARRQRPAPIADEGATPGELSMLEHMLADLEMETAKLDADHQTLVSGSSELFESQRSSQLLDDTADETSEIRDDPLTQVCWKSLRIGLKLAKNMHLLADELRREQSTRRLRDERLLALEERCQTHEVRYRHLETRYDEVVLQVDGMRDAMIATEEAVHRLTQELLRSRMQEKLGRSTSTPPPRPGGASRAIDSSSHPRRRRPLHSNGPSHVNRNAHVGHRRWDLNVGVGDEKENRRVTFDLPHESFESSLLSFVNDDDRGDHEEEVEDDDGDGGVNESGTRGDY